MDNLTGKSAIVSGGGTGIGRAIAIALAKEGIKVVLCGRREAPLDEVVQEILGMGAKL
jgi:3-oxoacyl-[acyl-carrier protein] reductase